MRHLLVVLCMGSLQLFGGGAASAAEDVVAQPAVACESSAEELQSLLAQDLEALPTEPACGTTTAINVTYVDNELYIIAVPSTGLASIELFHYMSGYGDGMNVTIVPQHVLSSGTYTLVFLGINWGGPGAFSVSLTTGGVTTPVPSASSYAVGCIWNYAVSITV